MRQDKLTTKFQQALAEAQSLALSNDNQYIEPEHILAAIMDDEEGGLTVFLNGPAPMPSKFARP